MKWLGMIAVLMLSTTVSALGETPVNLTKSYGYIPALYHCFCTDTLRAGDTVHCPPESLDYSLRLSEKCVKKFGTVNELWKDFSGPQFQFRTDTHGNRVITSVLLDIRFDSTYYLAGIGRTFVKTHSPSYKEFGYQLMYAYFPIYLLPELDAFPGIELIYQPNLDPMNIVVPAGTYRPSDSTKTK